MDPHDVLGIPPDAPPEEVAARYRELAKRWHPDANPEGAARMASINAAYDMVRSGVWQQRKQARDRTDGASGSRPPTPRARATAPRVGDWLEPSMRRALGPELLGALHRGEEVTFVTPTSLSASPQALLAVTDRRLLWLLDDAVTGRVRALDHTAITAVETRLSWPRKRSAALRVMRRNGRRPISFAELRPETANAIATLLRAKVRAA